MQSSTLAVVFARQGDPETARAELRWVRDLLPSASDPLVFPFAKLVSHVQWGAHSEAAAALQEALPHFRAVGHLRHEGSAWLNLGVA